MISLTQLKVWHRWLFQDTTDSSPPSNMKILGIRFGVRIVGHLQEVCRQLPFHSREVVRLILVALIVPGYVGLVQPP